MSTRFRRSRAGLSGLALALAGAMVGLVVVVPPAQAHPHLPPERSGNHCILPSFINVHINDPGTNDWVWGYEILWATKRFASSEGFSSINNTDQTQNAKFTTTEERTFTYSTTQSFSSSVTNSIIKGLTTQSQFGLSTTLTESTKTSRGIEISTTVPPRTTLQVEYGVYVQDVVYIFHVYHRDRNHPERQCREQGRTGWLTMTVPTTERAWQFTTTPLSGAAAPLVRSVEAAPAQ